MIIKSDGGAAFPSITTFYSDKTQEYELGEFIPGTSLRDYFAAAAIHGCAIDEREDADLAKWAYRLADAMLAEREKGK